MNLLLRVFALVLCTYRVAAGASCHIDNIIYIIADGFGPAQVTATRLLAGKSHVFDPWLRGTIATHSANSRVTDSAAAATALATGRKTYNGAIAVDARKQSLISILQRAKLKSYRTGIVVTSSVTDATPAAFYAHVTHRDKQLAIATQALQFQPDVLLGGGQLYFIPEAQGGLREDNRNLLMEAARQGYHVITTRQELEKSEQLPLLGLFAPREMTYAIDNKHRQEPTLVDTVSKALDLLAEKPFVLLVESSRIDHAGHTHDLAALSAEVTVYNQVMQVIKDFLQSHPNTLVIATADHETGGLALGHNRDRIQKYQWHPQPIRDVRASKAQSIKMLNQKNTSFSINKLLYLFGLHTIDKNNKKKIQLAIDNKKYGEAINVAAAIVDTKSGIAWTTTGHTGVDVNLYATGCHAEQFNGHFDNTLLAKKITLYLSNNHSNVHR